MDISDGLVIDCRRLCAASRIHATIDAPAIPFAAEIQPLMLSPDIFRIAITGGDDYEILASIRAGQETAFAAAAARAGVQVTKIGSIAAGEPGLTVIGRDGAPLDVSTGGFDHFRS
jgi:thiamine-monophosphate kinase